VGARSDRVTNADGFECTERVHDHVHDAVQIACRSAAPLSPCTRAPRRSRRPSCRRAGRCARVVARGHDGIAPIPNSPRPLGRVKGALRRSLVTFVAPLTRPARSRPGWLLPERRRRLSLPLDLNAEFDHGAQV
jgi:hypothetical protein